MSTRDRIVDTDWSKLILGQRTKHLEVEGYVVLPDLLTRDHVARFDTKSNETIVFFMVLIPQGDGVRPVFRVSQRTRVS